MNLVCVPIHLLIFILEAISAKRQEAFHYILLV